MTDDRPPAIVDATPTGLAQPEAIAPLDYLILLWLHEQASPRTRREYAATISDFRVALAIQNGASVGHVPWDDIDAVFIAGDKAFKTSATAWAICREARRRRLHIHIARRNSKKAMQAAYDMGADSIDGTHLAFAPDANWERTLRWFREFCSHDEVRHWADDRRFGRCVTCGADVWRVTEVNA